LAAPFSRKFLLEHEYIFKDNVKQMLKKIELNDVVDLFREFKQYALDTASMSLQDLTDEADFTFGGYFKAFGLPPDVEVIDLVDNIPAINVFYLKIF
jgi:hypothetical protein